MGDVGVVLGTGVALGVVYALLGVAVSGVAVATRTLHLAVGAVVAAAVPLQVALSVEEVTGIGDLPALLGALLLAVLVSAALAPLAGTRARDLSVGLVGLVVAGGVLEAATARWLSTATLRPNPIIATGDLDLGGFTLAEPAVAAMLVGLPGAAALVWVLVRTRLGARLRLVGGSPAAADQLGFSLGRLRAAAFALSGAAAVLAGLLVAPLTFAGPAASAGLTVRAVAAAALLGLGRPTAALAGGLALGLAEAVGASLWPAAGGEVAVTLLVVGVLGIRAGETGPAGIGGPARAW